MNDWSDYALGRLKKQAEDQRVEDQTLLEKQKVTKASGTPLWQEVRRIVKENSDHLNTKAGKDILAYEVTPNTEIRVRAHLGSGVLILQATFDEETGTLAWKCGSKGDSWQLAVAEDGTVAFCWGMGVPTNPGAMAKQMLDALLFN